MDLERVSITLLEWGSSADKLFLKMNIYGIEFVLVVQFHRGTDVWEPLKNEQRQSEE